MKTIRQLELEAESILGVKVEYDNYATSGMVFAIHYTNMPDVRIPKLGTFDDNFTKMGEEQQRWVLLHEKGHINSWEKRLPGHLKHYLLKNDLSNELYFEKECEADFYAAQEVGIENAIKFLKETLPTNVATRELYLLNKWDNYKKSKT